MLYVGTKGINISIGTGWDLTDITTLDALLQRPDKTVVVKTLSTLDFDTVLTSGMVRVPIDEPDLSMTGVYHIQIRDTNGDVVRYSARGSFSVSAPLKEV
jgi:hypothetical protein